MNQFKHFQAGVNDNTTPDQYITDALKYIAHFQTDHNGVIDNDYLAMLKDHYATPHELSRFFKPLTSQAHLPQEHHFYKVVANGELTSLSSLTPADLSNITINVVTVADKGIVYHAIHDMVEEYLDATDSVKL